MGSPHSYTHLKHLCLLVVFLVYTVLGGWVFHQMEAPTGPARNASAALLQFHALLGRPCRGNPGSQCDCVSHAENVTGRELSEGQVAAVAAAARAYSEAAAPPSAYENWDMYASVYFAATTLTTIGYGSKFVFLWKLLSSVCPYY